LEKAGAIILDSVKHTNESRICWSIRMSLCDGYNQSAASDFFQNKREAGGEITSPSWVVDNRISAV
jgi:hypothetical protein